MKTPYDQQALIAERSRNRAAIKYLRRARRLWMQDPNIISAHWVEPLPDGGGERVVRIENGRATTRSVGLGMNDKMSAFYDGGRRS